MMINIGDTVPTIPFTATNEISTTLQHYADGWLVLYFYPKDATPGCTTEGIDFTEQVNAFTKLNTTILGVSRDTLTSHEKFKAKHAFPFELISDPDELLCQAFDVIQMKSMYGKKVRGIERSTFIIDPEGTIRHLWRKVRVKNHVAEVLSTLEALQLKSDH